MSADRNRRVWERASLGGERLMNLIVGVLHLVRWLDMQVEISSRQLGFIYKRGYMAAKDSSCGTQNW